MKNNFLGLAFLASICYVNLITAQPCELSDWPWGNDIQHVRWGISGDDPANCPEIHITGIVSVPATATLEILPGTTIVFDDLSSYLAVYGDMRVNGDPENAIVFALSEFHTLPTNCSSDWNGPSKIQIRRTRSSTHEFSYCEFRGLPMALQVNDANFRTAAFALDVRDCQFVDCGYGIYLENTQQSSTEIVRCRFIWEAPVCWQSYADGARHSWRGIHIYENSALGLTSVSLQTFWHRMRYCFKV